MQAGAQEWTQDGAACTHGGAHVGLLRQCCEEGGWSWRWWRLFGQSGCEPGLAAGVDDRACLDLSWDWLLGRLSCWHRACGCGGGKGWC
eukprot:scaffold123130_cov18-Tisochrysis_lutea.AAC.1